MFILEKDQMTALELGEKTTVVIGNTTLKDLEIKSLKHGGRHVHYIAEKNGSSAKVILLKKGVRISQLVGHEADIHRTVGTALHVSAQVKETCLEALYRHARQNRM